MPRLAAFLLIALIGPIGLLLKAAAADPAQWETVARESTGGFIMSLASDAEGNVWIGTEDKGIVRVNPDNVNPLLHGGQQFTRKDGAPDNGYALAVDPKGRIWAGSLRHGVSVFNGDKWQSYDVLDGPIGERIFHIAVCPTDGDVWMATSAGLTRYSQKSDSWSYHTRSPSTQREQVSGLPSDQANALAFNAKGDLFVGTQCDGIAISRAADDYRTWQAHGGQSVGFTAPTGRGLPTALINGLLVAKTGTVYAATSAGLAWSKDAGKTWQYLRGKDYAAKVKGRWGGTPRGWQEAPKAVMDNLLPEDYVTCIAESNDGLIWLGFRQQGYAALDPKTFRIVFRGTKKSERLPDDFVTCILPMADYRPYIGTYAGGVAKAKKPMKAAGAKVEAKAALKKEKKTPHLPVGARPPSLAETAAITKWLELSPKGKNLISYLSEDWKTRGDFYGKDKYKDYRYGEFIAHLCAFSSPFDAVWGNEPMRVRLAKWTGSHADPKETVRHWVHWVSTKDDRSLKNPADDTRRQAEWDDHGEAYPHSHEGPHLYVDFHLPAGEFNVTLVTLYFFNKDGHDGQNRSRDYLVTLKQYARTDAEFRNAPMLARCRVVNFWGGVYKTFSIEGARGYTVEINKNGSFNTICSGIFIDPAVDEKDAANKRGDIPRIRQSFKIQEAARLRRLPNDQKEDPHLQALAILGALGERKSKSSFARRSRHSHLLLSRALRDDPDSEIDYRLLQRARAACFHQLRLFDLRDSIYSDLEK